MRKASISIILLFALFLACTAAASCNKQPPVAEPENHDNNQVTQEANIPIKKDNAQTPPKILAVYQITQKNCRLKDEPRDDAAILVNLDIGMPVNVIEQRPDGWFEVILMYNYSNDKVTGYIKKDSLQPVQLHEDEEFYESASIREQRVIANNPDSAKRDGDTLTLILQNGKELNLTDQPGMEGFEYFLEDFKGKSFLVCKANNVEGYDYEIISQENGDILQVPIDPILSPDGQRIAVLTPAPVLYRQLIKLTVYSIRNKHLIQEIEMYGIYRTVSDLRWINNDEIEFTSNYRVVQNDDFRGYASWKDRLLLDNGKWSFQNTHNFFLLPAEVIGIAEQKGIKMDQLEKFNRLNYSQEDISNFSINEINEIIVNKKYKKV